MEQGIQSPKAIRFIPIPMRTLFLRILSIPDLPRSIHFTYSLNRFSFLLSRPFWALSSVPTDL